MGEHRREILASFYLSLAFALALCVFNWWIEETDFGKRVLETTYGLLQHYLSLGDTAENSEVVVLDISGIRMVPSRGFHEENITSRAPLLRIVTLLAKSHPGPSAIGLDVDFSPDTRGFADRGDGAVLESLLELAHSTGVPIRVGVHQSVALGPDKWLRDPKYMELASCVVVPKPEKWQSTRYMPKTLEVTYEGKPPGKCTLMGDALAEAVKARKEAEAKAVPDVPVWKKWFAESSRQRKFGPLRPEEILVDYSPLDFLVPAPQIRAGDAPPKIEVRKQKGDGSETWDDGTADIFKKVEKKIVLLGRTIDTTNDTFTVPGRPETPYAGVYLHACAAYTLLDEKRSLYVPIYPVRLFGDAFLSVVIFGIVLWIRWQGWLARYDEFLERHFPEALAVLVAVILILLETRLLRMHRVMWDDFILVTVVLLAHSPIEHVAVWLAGPVRSWLHASAPSSHPRSEGD